jgi:hypothetical protein
VPTLFVPMSRELDDQAARARYAEQSGLALACEGPASSTLERRLGEMLDTSLRARLSARARELGTANGADEAARLLSGLATRGDRTRVGLPRPRPGRAAMWVTMARARASALLRHPAERRRSPHPELVCMALGVSDEELRAGIARLSADGVEPARLVVATDSPAFGVLRDAGVVLVYVPPRPEIEARMPGVDYDALVRRRVAEALAGCSPRRFEAIGPARGDLARWIPTPQDGA